MNTSRLVHLFASLGLAATLGACGSSVDGGSSSGDGDGDGDGDGVVAVNLETGERREFPSEEDVPQGWGLCDGEDCPTPLGCTEIGESACLARVDCAPLYDDAGSFAGCSDGGATCDADACGPMPGMSAIECPDGSIGGNTGRCIEQGDACGWEIRECPDPTCDEGACGPELGMPAYLCDDGSVGGNTGQCLANPDGTCGWEIRECPEDNGCTPDACGPPPPGMVCADGSSNVGACEETADGTCAWTIRECPETLCDESECGPQPGLPTEICEDGSIGGSTGRCILYDGDLCGWEVRPCPEDGG